MHSSTGLGITMSRKIVGGRVVEEKVVQLPTLNELDKALRSMDLWEVDNPPEVVAKGRRERRPWLY